LKKEKLRGLVSSSELATTRATHTHSLHSLCVGGTGRDIHCLLWRPPELRHRRLLVWGAARCCDDGHLGGPRRPAADLSLNGHSAAAVGGVRLSTGARSSSSFCCRRFSTLHLISGTSRSLCRTRLASISTPSSIQTELRIWGTGKISGRTQARVSTTARTLTA
jgi:hypothetical protein